MNNTSTLARQDAKQDAARNFFAWKKDLYQDETLKKLAAKGEWDIRLTASVLADCFGSWGAECRPMMSTVARIIGCNERTVRRQMAELVSLGWFTQEKRPGKTTVYGIAHPGHQDVRGTPDTRMSDDTNEINTSEIAGASSAGDTDPPAWYRETDEYGSQIWLHCPPGKYELMYEPDGREKFTCGVCGEVLYPDQRGTGNAPRPADEMHCRKCSEFIWDCGCTRYDEKRDRMVPAGEWVCGSCGGRIDSYRNGQLDEFVCSQCGHLVASVE